MDMAIDGGKLRLELIRRGWTAAELAERSGISRPTISAALHSRPIAARSIKLIAVALAQTPAVDGIDGLI